MKRFNENTPFILLEWICVALGAWFCVALLVIAGLTMGYPFPMEWMEGHVIDTVQRVASGKALYTKPSVEFVPAVFTPLYYYASAFISLFTGVDFMAGRMVSFFATLGTGAVIYSWVRKEGGEGKYALIAAGLFFATYKLSGRWFMIANADNLALFLVMAGMYALFHLRGQKHALITAALFTTAFFTKQTTLLIILPVLAARFLENRQHAALTTAFFLIGSCFLITCYNVASGGWFGFYVFTVPAGHTIEWRYLTNFWTDDMLWWSCILFLMALSALVMLWQENRGKALQYMALAVGLIGTSYAMRLHSGSYYNALMPAHAGMALLAGIAIIPLKNIKHLPAKYLNILLLLGQMLLLLHNPLATAPSAKAMKVGERLLKDIGSIEGDVFIPELQFVQTRVGKKSYGYGLAAFDLMRAELGENNAVKRELNQELKQMIRNQRFAAIIPGRIFRLPQMKDLYVFDHNLDNSNEYKTGAFHFPRRIYVRAPMPKSKRKLP